MTKSNPITALTSIVEILTPLSSDERARTIRAAMELLGESQLSNLQGNTVQSNEGSREFGDLPIQAQRWVRQNGISREQLQEVFHFSGDQTEVIASHLPGSNKREQTLNGYVLTGIAQLLRNGTASFQDEMARTLCERSGCYDTSNHSSSLKKRGNRFTGSKDKGWTLTAPGLKQGAEIIKVLANND